MGCLETCARLCCLHLVTLAPVVALGRSSLGIARLEPRGNGEEEEEEEEAEEEEQEE